MLQIRFFISCIILLLAFLSLYKAIQQSHSLSKLKRLFLFLFILMLILPASYLHNHEVNRWENRNYYPLPNLFHHYTLNNHFGKEFDKYFSDRILGRKDMINVHSLLDKVNKRQKNDKVLEGKDGWLFYKFDNSISNFKNEIRFNANELDLILKNLQYIRSFNSHIFVLIPPDKNKIYGEFYPDEIQKIHNDNYSRAMQLTQKLQENQFPTVYPYHALHKAKNKGLLYFKHGTHWNKLGAEIAFIELVNLLKQNKYSIDYKPAQSYIPEIKKDLDLEHMFPNFKDFDHWDYLTPVLQDNVKTPLKVFMFTDSFSEALSPYLEQLFTKIDTFPYKKMYHFDFNILRNYDIVVIECLERFLWRLKFEEGL